MFPCRVNSLIGYSAVVGFVDGLTFGFSGTALISADTAMPRAIKASASDLSTSPVSPSVSLHPKDAAAFRSIRIFISVVQTNKKKSGLIAQPRELISLE
jgi:hypothetical protein